MLFSRLRGQFPTVRGEISTLLRKTHCNVTPIPSVAGPLAMLNNALDSLKRPGVTGPVAKQAAVSACETARNACRHVEIATKGHHSSWPTMPRQTYYPPQYAQPSIQPVFIDVDSLDKSQLIELSKGRMPR